MNFQVDILFACLAMSSLLNIQSNSDEMINCTRYLMSKDEFEACKHSVDKKAAIDQFWITIAGSSERAKELLKKEVLFKSDVETLIGKRPYEEKKALDIIDNPKDAVIEDPTSGIIVETPA